MGLIAFFCRWQGKRKRDGFLSEEEVKDNLKASQRWQQASVRTDSSTHEGYQYPQFQGPMVESWIRMQQQQKTDVAATASLPVLNMEQRIMAAAVLQVHEDVRPGGIVTAI